MALRVHERNYLLKVLSGQHQDMTVAVIELAGAILDLEQQLELLKRKVEHAEMLAGRHDEEG